jgi:hypothetical protein
MRFSTAAAAVCLSLLPVAGGFAAATPAERVDLSVAAAPPTGDAAAKHAKRTACLKVAKARKLVGVEKTSFLKDCIAAP